MAGLGPSPSAIWAKLNVLSWLEKDERIADIWHNVRFANITLCAIHDNVDRITEIAKSGTKYLCSKTTTVLSVWTVSKTMDMSLLLFYCIRNK